MKKKISLIAAVAKNGVIGNNGTLPWHLKKDFEWFVKKTTGKIVVMGRKNYEDIIRFTKGKPLKDRTNVILTTKPLVADGFIVVHSIAQLLSLYPNDELMIIGGTQIYELFVPLADEFILTEIHHEFEGDTYFPQWHKEKYILTYQQKENEKNIDYDFCIYEKII